MQQHYVENFVQSTFSALDPTSLSSSPSTLILGGDGRYFNPEMIQTIIAMSAANGVSHVVVGQHGLLSTPAVSALIRRYRHTTNNNNNKVIGGFILTASHNPGGKDNDCGIKYNVANGGPAPESITDKIYINTTKITEYYKADVPVIDLSKIGVTKVSDEFTVEVIDATDGYVELMREVFDFKMIKEYVEKTGFRLTFDGMHGVAGPYAKAVFSGELGIDESNLLNCDPKEDFGGGHPDPNLTYAHDLVKTMGLTSTGAALDGVQREAIADMGAACDGDADR